MKKRFAIILIIIMFIFSFLFVGCGKEENDKHMRAIIRTPKDDILEIEIHSAMYYSTNVRIKALDGTIYNVHSNNVMLITDP